MLFFCFEDDCPIKFEFHAIIHYQAELTNNQYNGDADYQEWCWEKAYGKCPALMELVLKYPTPATEVILKNNLKVIL